MIVYADASALVKRYVMEVGSKEVNALTTAAAAVATAIVSRAEVAAAFARAVRMHVLDEEGGRRAQRRFSREWPNLVRVMSNNSIDATSSHLRKSSASAAPRPSRTESLAKRRLVLARAWSITMIGIDPTPPARFAIAPSVAVFRF
jgi:predicted nucleic acid-binding protein